jgi:selenide,water dikinase
MEEVKLTQFSHGAGCGCKIAPSVLEQILGHQQPKNPDARLLVGYDTKDDAAVYDLQNGTGLISTTDFFMPIVDDAFTFGAIASANALSDVYAMGGTPLLALAILGWPIEKLAPALAQQVLEGARSICAQANIPLAGGHSIDSREPIFGLAVSGTVALPHLKKNSTAKAGNLLYLTKPLGVGMVTTAQKRGLAKPEHIAEAIAQMTTLNKVGAQLGSCNEVTALTDVTGFGLLGHLLEVCTGSGVSATLDYQNVPLLACARHYASAFIYPDNTMRNWNSYQHQVEGIGSESLLTLCDPQTSGGLLICVDENQQATFERKLADWGFALTPIGALTSRKEKAIYLNPH